MKKLFSILLVLTMVFTVLTLSACKTEPEATSSDAASSEESVTPPTKTEQFNAALAGFEGYITNLGASFGSEINTEAVTNGTSNGTVTLDTFTMMGEPVIPGEPLKIDFDSVVKGTDSNTSLILYLAGDEVLLDLYTSADAFLLELPGVYDDVIELDLSSLTEETEELPEVDDETLNKIMDSIETAFTETVDLESVLNITEADGKKVYSFTLNEETLNKFAEAMEKKFEEAGLDDLFGLNDATDDTDVEISEESEEDTEDSLVFELTASGDLPTSLRISAYEDETAVFEILFSANKTDNTTAFEASIISEEEALMEASLSLTESETEIKLEGELIIDTVKMELALSSTKESETKNAYSGTVSVTMDMDGMLVTVPVSISGTVEQKGDSIEETVTVSTSVTGMFELTLSCTATTTPGMPEIELMLPENRVSMEDIDSDALGTQLVLTYPNAMQFLAGLSGGTEDYPDDLTSIDYTNEDETLYLSVYSDGTATIGAECTFTDSNEALIFSFDGREIYSLPYNYTEDMEYIVLFGKTFESMFYDDDSVNLYRYEEDGTYIDLTLYYTDGTAFVSFNLPVDPEAEDLVLLLPDGDTFTLELEMSEDGTSLTLGETEMSLVVYEE